MELPIRTSSDFSPGSTSILISYWSKLTYSDSNMSYMIKPVSISPMYNNMGPQIFIQTSDWAFAKRGARSTGASLWSLPKAGIGKAFQTNSEPDREEVCAHQLEVSVVGLVSGGGKICSHAQNENQHGLATLGLGCFVCI